MSKEDLCNLINLRDSILEYMPRDTVQHFELGLYSLGAIIEEAQTNAQ